MPAEHEAVPIRADLWEIIRGGREDGDGVQTGKDEAGEDECEELLHATARRMGAAPPAWARRVGSRRMVKDSNPSSR